MNNLALFRSSAEIRRPAFVLTACAIAASSWIVSASSPAGAEGTVDPSTPVLASGTILDAGTPQAGVTVSLVAQPTQQALTNAGDAGVATLPIASTTSASDGSYRIWGSVADVPSEYVGKSGQVDLEIVFDDAGVGTSWNYTLFPAGTDEPGITVPVAEGDMPAITSEGGTAGNKLAPVLAVDLGSGTTWAAGPEVPEDGEILPPEQRTAEGGFDPLDLTALPGVDVAEFNTAELTEYASEYLEGSEPSTARANRSASEPAGTYPVCYSRWTDNWKRNLKEKVVAVHGWKYAKVKVTQGTEQTTVHTLGVAIVNTDGTFSQTGTASKSFSSGTSATTQALTDSIVHNRVNYRMKHYTCQPTKWFPYSLYDLNTDITDTYNAIYHNCSSKAAGAKWNTGTARNETYSGGLSFGPVNLSSQAGYGNSVYLSFEFDRNGKICGNLAGGPASSKRVSSGPQ